MRRRLPAVLLAVLVAALAVTAVALAHGGGGDHDRGAKERHGVRAHHRGDRDFAFGGGLLGVVLNSLADRLDVRPDALRAAVKAVAVEQRDQRLKAAGLTQADIDALKACRRGFLAQGASATCDRAAARAALQKLRAAPKPDLTQLKADLAASLASKLGKTPDQVLTAVRAELEQRLGQAVAMGWLTARGRDLALGCFDTPASCDLDALRAEVRFFGGDGARHRHHG